MANNNYYALLHDKDENLLLIYYLIKEIKLRYVQLVFRNH